MSGGADSTALLLGLHRLEGELDLELSAAHLHHGLRGADADADLAFVRELCGRLEVPLIAARWNTTERMRRRGLSGHAGLRTLRREFLAAAARRARCPWVATAHTADDQLETILMRLVRGTGLSGIGGMSARRGPWLKPLLEATRAAIEADLTAAGMGWREDASNRDLSRVRGRIRHVVIPALVEAGGRGASDHRQARIALTRRVARTAAELRSARRTLQTLAKGAVSRVCRIQGGEIALDSKRLGFYPISVQHILLRHLWSRVAPALRGLTYHHLEALHRLSGSPRGGSRVDLPAGWTAAREGEDLVFRRPARDAGATGSPPSSKIPGRGRWALGGLEGRWLTGARSLGALRNGPDRGVAFAAEGLDGELELRPASPDESFIPYGRVRARSLREFLSKERHPRVDCRGPVVLADRQGILWVVGVRRSARALLTPGTRRALWIDAEPHE